MNQAEYLCHSSGPWKNHKYFQKIGEGANAVYKYAKKKGAELADAAGADEREEYLKTKKVHDRLQNAVERDNHQFVFSRASARADEFDKHYDAFNAENLTEFQNNTDRWREQGNRLRAASSSAFQKAAEAERKYYKTPMGKLELSAAGKAVTKGEKILKEFFKKK